MLHRIYTLHVSGLLLLSGCAPAVLTQPPVDWPAECRGRKLYPTPQALIYASSPAAAGEIDRLIIAVAAQFPATANGAAPAQGLAIVTDLGDQEILDLDALLEAALANQQQASSRPATQPESRPPSQPATQVAPALARIREQTAEMGIDLREMFEMKAIRMPPALIAPVLSVSQEALHDRPWMLLLPTRSRVERSCRSLFAAMLRSKEMTPAQRVLAAPLLLAMQPMMMDLAAADREVVLFEAMAETRPDWSPAQRKEATKAFKDARLRPFQLGMKAAVGQAAARAAAESQPATQSAPAAAPELSPESQPSAEGLHSR